jgi:hypothetical protein
VSGAVAAAQSQRQQRRWGRGEGMDEFDSGGRSGDRAGAAAAAAAGDDGATPPLPQTVSSRMPLVSPFVDAYYGNFGALSVLLLD